MLTGWSWVDGHGFKGINSFFSKIEILDARGVRFAGIANVNEVT